VGDLDVADVSRFWEGRSVLVTGAAGFLGPWVVEAFLNVGARVAALDIKGLDERTAQLEGATDVIADVRDHLLVRETLSDIRPDVIVHLAAQSQVTQANEDPVATLEANVQGTWTVLEAARTSAGASAIVVASSDKAYGDADGRPYEETLPLRGRHPYDVSKACADLIAQAYAASYGLPVVISRCANLYGGGDRHWNRIVPGTIRSCLLGQLPVIRSDGKPVRDYLYVEDAAIGVLELAHAASLRPELHGEAFNFSSGDRLSALDLVRRILDLMNSALEPDIRNESFNELGDQRVDATKARSMLGWKAAFDIDTGLRRTIAWYRSHLELITTQDVVRSS
jgi:CDP-glucose 4,6-dehydratase